MKWSLHPSQLNMSHAFTWSFSNLSDNEAESLPPTLKSFLHMLLYGRGIDQPLPVSQKSKVITSIGQQIIFYSFTMETRVRSWTALSRQILTIRDQWRQLLYWMVLYSFKCFVLEVLRPSETISQMCLCHTSSLGLKEIIGSISSGMFTARRAWSQEFVNKEAV